MPILNKKKKILYLYYTNLGNAKVTVIQFLNTIEALARHYNVTYLSHWFREKTLNAALQNYNIQKAFTIIRMPVFPIPTKPGIMVGRFFYALYSYLFALVSVYDYLYTRDFSVVYFLARLPSTFKPKAKIVFEIHKIYHKTSKYVRFEQEKKAYRCVDYFLATSDNCKSDLLTYFDIDPTQVIVTPNGVDLAQFQRKENTQDILKKYGLTRKQKIVIYAGSFLWWKGVDDLIYAMKYVKDKDARLLLIGGYGEDFQKMKQIVKEEKLADHVVFTGYLLHYEMIDLLHCAQVAILPNNRSIEGENYTSPVKLFEYLACGLPIIASELDSIKEILREPDHCLFFEPEDQQGLAARIDQLLADRKLRRTMTMNNLEYVKQFTWEKKAEKIYTFLEQP